MVSVTLTISFLQPPNSNDITVLLIHSEQWFTKCGSQTSRKGDVITRNADPQATHQIYWTRSWFSPRCLNKPTRWSWRTPRWDTTHVRMLLQTRIPEWVAMSSSRGSSQPRDRTLVSHIVGRLFYYLSQHGAQEHLRTGAKRKLSSVLPWVLF